MNIVLEVVHCHGCSKCARDTRDGFTLRVRRVEVIILMDLLLLLIFNIAVWKDKTKTLAFKGKVPIEVKIIRHGEAVEWQRKCNYSRIM